MQERPTSAIKDPSDEAKPFVTEATQIPFWRTEIGDIERELVNDAFDEKRFSMGAGVAAFERALAEQLDVPHVVMTTSGSTALLMAMIALEIGPGDEVIVPTRTFVATAHAATLLGAKAVLVDCLREDTNVDVAAVAAHVTSRTRAIVPVHLNGKPCDMDAILAVARRHGLRVVEDAAQGLFSKGDLGNLGTLGDIGCFSFGVVKLISTGQGGAAVTRDPALFKSLQAIRNHGVSDVTTHTYRQPGGNFKPTDLQAAIGLGQLRRLEDKIGRVNAIYRRYADGLANHPHIRVLPVDVENGAIALWTEAMSERRDEMMTLLASRGIQTRRFIPCCHTAPHLATETSFPNSDYFNRTGLNLPCGPSMPLEFVDRTVETLWQFDPEPISSDRRR